MIFFAKYENKLKEIEGIQDIPADLILAVQSYSILMRYLNEAGLGSTSYRYYADATASNNVLLLPGNKEMKVTDVYDVYNMNCIGKSDFWKRDDSWIDVKRYFWKDFKKQTKCGETKIEMDNL
jgi:hypothetical protein